MVGLLVIYFVQYSMKIYSEFSTPTSTNPQISMKFEIKTLFANIGACKRPHMLCSNHEIMKS